MTLLQDRRWQVAGRRANRPPGQQRLDRECAQSFVPTPEMPCLTFPARIEWREWAKAHEWAGLEGSTTSLLRV